ncbi:ATP synthase F0 subunit B [Hippea jasoniae]|uniref:ATP synthase F0 subunit B n=1 Tax=Hippea jasoniae TaxID=944479 RepID=UPI00068BB935|nr:ATP synthase F0 subunit B [Hippea jasoniae]
MINIDYTLFLQMAAFLILMLLLNVILYKPLLKTIKERFNRIETLRSEAERLKSEALKYEEEYNSRLTMTEEDAKKKYNNAILSAMKERDEKIFEQKKQAAAEIGAFEDEVKKQIDIEINASKDFAIEIANKIYKQLFG